MRLSSGVKEMIHMRLWSPCRARDARSAARSYDCGAVGGTLPGCETTCSVRARRVPCRASASSRKGSARPRHTQQACAERRAGRRGHAAARADRTLHPQVTRPPLSPRPPPPSSQGRTPVRGRRGGFLGTTSRSLALPRFDADI